jgi:hypothetical protein
MLKNHVVVHRVGLTLYMQDAQINRVIHLKESGKNYTTTKTIFL